MPAYVIADIEVDDAAAYEAYKRDVGASVNKFGGRFIVRGGPVVPHEGGWCPQRIVVIEFPDMASLDAWYKSAEYKPLLDLRLAATRGRLIAVEGA
jgi:uncharacterized protein (DUF1330 family)